MGVYFWAVVWCLCLRQEFLFKFFHIRHKIYALSVYFRAVVWCLLCLKDEILLSSFIYTQNIRPGCLFLGRSVVYVVLQRSNPSSSFIYTHKYTSWVFVFELCGRVVLVAVCMKNEILKFFHKHPKIYTLGVYFRGTGVVCGA